MIRFLLRRLLLVPLALLAVNFLSFAYARVAWEANAKSNPFFHLSASLPPLRESYPPYLLGLLRLDLGMLPNARGPVLAQFTEAARYTVGLLAIAFVASVVVGLLLGLLAVRTRPPGASGWLLPLSTFGLALPSFYIGAVLIAGTVLYVLGGFGKPPLPLGGFGWDKHLVVPVLALAIRPAVQIAQLTSRLLGEELNRLYIVAARSLGHSWYRIRWRTALRNVLAPIILGITGSFRVLLGELILVEWLVGWPGLGRMLVGFLTPPQTTSSAGTLWLDAPSVATSVTILALLFLLVDGIASLLVRLADPRLREGMGEVARG